VAFFSTKPINKPGTSSCYESLGWAEMAKRRTVIAYLGLFSRAKEKFLRAMLMIRYIFRRLFFNVQRQHHLKCSKQEMVYFNFMKVFHRKVHLLLKGWKILLIAIRWYG
jgi:hypothetical protein